MAILDATVVTEKKELAVPDFNKKEVEGIAVDAVKTEIAAGNIPTGTKLYLHTITDTSNFVSIKLITSELDVLNSTNSQIYGFGYVSKGGASSFAGAIPGYFNYSSKTMSFPLVSEPGASNVQWKSINLSNATDTIAEL